MDDARIERLIHGRDYRAALRAVADAYGRSLGRFCQAQLGSAADGADALQETLCAALVAMPAYRGDGGVRAWLFAIGRRQCADVIRAQARRRSIWSRMFRHGDATLPTTASPDDGSDARLALERALLGLLPAQREAVLLRYQQGMDASEVADVLGISHASARKRISLGMQALRVALVAPASGPRAASNPRSADALAPADPELQEEDHDGHHALRASEDAPFVRS